MTGHNYLQIFLYIPLIHLLYLWNQSEVLRDVQHSYKDVNFLCLK